VCSTHPAAEETGLINSEAVNQTADTATGCNADGLVASAVSNPLGGTFWQQPVDFDICIWPHW
jgi:hypothetical protein